MKNQRMPITYTPDKPLTEPGGIHKEAHMLGVPCITLRENTEWVETLEGGGNVLVGADKRKIVEMVRSTAPTDVQRMIFGSKGASERILNIIGCFEC